jgi:hypothetical protein
MATGLSGGHCCFPQLARDAVDGFHMMLSRVRPCPRPLVSLAGVLLATAVVASVIAPIVDAQTDPESLSSDAAVGQHVRAGTALKVGVPGAQGRRTILGQIAVAGATDRGFVTAYACADGRPKNPDGSISKADLNFDGGISPVSSNRLVVQADVDGDVCLYTSSSVEMIVDLTAVSAGAVSSMPNRRTDTRASGVKVSGATPLKVNAPEAVGGGTVFGQLAVGQVADRESRPQLRGPGVARCVESSHR